MSRANVVGARAADGESPVQKKPAVVVGGAWRVRVIEAAPLATSRIAAMLGALSLLDVLWSRHWHPISVVNPVLGRPADAAAHAISVVAGFVLLRISAGLRKRQRSGWRLAVAGCLAICLVDLVRGDPRPLQLTVAIVLLMLLALARPQFTARSDRRSQWYAAQVAGQLLGVALSYGMLLLYLPGHVASGTGFGARLQEVLASLVGLGGSLRVSGDEYADRFHAVVFGFGLLAAICVIVLLLRPTEPAARFGAVDEARLRSLLSRHGARDSLGYFALRRDKSVVWSSTGKSAITYRVVAGVALVSGDPIGDPEAWPGAIAAFRALVEEYGWTPAVMGCSELGATVFRREYGLCALALGDEAILRASEFSLDGRAVRGVRQACTRILRAGYEVEVRRVADIDTDEIEDVRAAADAWRGSGGERGYSMALSRLGDAADGDCLLVTARQGDVLRGLLHFVPWGEHGISLDLMRRDRTTENGVNELMIANVMQACPALGVENVSLNFAVFRDALERGERIGAGPAVRVWRRLLLMASRWWQIESLYRFNAKFHPHWEPRFICYPSARYLPRITLAALEAEAFIVRPRIVNRILGRG